MTAGQLLIFIPAYNADSTIASVIQRIPRDLAYDTTVLIIDDASQDRTIETARAYVEENPLAYPVVLLRNPRNQGYGGNQKLAYRYAIDNDFDAVVMVHGDGQYPPEAIEAVANPVIEGHVQACFGSRFIREGGARAGGMPYYKWLGNRILTSVQNRLLKTRLTEFHSGFRAYGTCALKDIPFEINSSDFHFDTEIIIQLHRAGYSISEHDIPTYYGDEKCHVNGVSYGLNVLLETLKSRIHDMGMLYERKFDVGTDSSEEIYESKVHFQSPTTMAMNRVEEGSSVLDLGASSGHLARALSERGCRVTGVDVAPVDELPPGFVAYYTADLDRDELGGQAIPIEPDNVDVVVMLDVIEHLRNPEDFVSRLAEFCQTGGVERVLVSTGNIGFFITRFALLLGQFNYGRRGILDKTHTRLFTFRSIRKLFEQSGFEVEACRGVPAPFPLALGEGAATKAMIVLNRWFLRVLPGLFSYQIFLEMRPPISPRVLLDQAHAEANDRLNVRAL